MATKPPSAAGLVAWNWAIESLATFKQIDVSVFPDLVKRTPGGPDEFGRSAKEIFSFRILESLFDPGTGITKACSSPLDSKIGFDLSDRCVDVLEHILLEIHGPNMKDKLEKLKWDVQAFILHKRSCLPKCALEQLKDAILQGSHPCLASLKERAGLLHENRSESGINVNDGDCRGSPDKIEGSTNEQFVATRNSSSMNPEYGGDLFEEHFPERNMVHTKTVQSNLDKNTEKTAYKDQVIVENGYNTHSDDAKKFDHDQICLRKTLKHKLVPLHRAEQFNDVEDIRVYAGTKGCELPKELQAVEINKITDDDDREELPQSCNNVDDTILGDPQEVNFNDGKVPSGASKVREGQSIYVDEKRYDENEGSDEVSSTSALNAEAKDNMESELSAENDGYLKEMTDISTKKHALLSYKCMLREENNVESHRKDSIFCVHCNKGGKLLVCSSEACPLALHKRCLKSADTFDSKGKFYCYFCAYSRLVSDFQDAKQSYSLARKNLSASICGGMKRWQEIFVKKSYVSEKTEQRLNKPTHKRKRNDVNRVGGTRHKANREVEQTGSSEIYAAAAAECSERKGEAPEVKTRGVELEEQQNSNYSFRHRKRKL